MNGKDWDHGSGLWEDGHVLETNLLGDVGVSPKKSYPQIIHFNRV